MPDTFEALYDYDPLRGVLYPINEANVRFSGSTGEACRMCYHALEPLTSVLDPGGRKVCASCYATHFTTCMICTGVVQKTNARSRMIRGGCCDADNKYVCMRCFETVNLISAPYNVWSCRDCGFLSLSTVPSVRDRNGTARCLGCTDARRERIESIVDYSTDVTAYLPYYDEPKDNLLMGVELEVQVYDSSEPKREARKVRSLFPDFAICKKDSSIGVNGFEIVTVPSSIDGHYKEWTAFFNDPPKVTSWKGGQCGMHVHIARKSMSALTIGKMLQFVNDPMNQALIATVAGRGSTDFCRIIQKKVTDSVTVSRLNYHPETGNAVARGGYRLYAENRHSNDRHEAINLNNTNTVELRIFRGTMNRTSFFKNLEFTHALVKFCGSVGITDLTIAGFVGWLKPHHNTYPHLVQFLSSPKGRTFILDARKIERKTLKDGRVFMTNNPLLQDFIKENEEVFANV